MPTTIIREKNSDTERYMRALRMIEEGHRELKELTEKMVDQFGERRGTYGDRDGDGRYNERYDQRGGYGERYGERYDERYDQRDGYGHYDERRDSMGRYR